MRVRTFMALLGLLLVVSASPAHAQDEPVGESPPTTLTELPGAVAIGDGFSFTGAVITPPGGGPTRSLDAYQAAVFVQSWLAQSLYGGPDIARDPPPEVPVHQIDIMGNWAGPVGTITVYFAQDGTTPYIAFPQTQAVATEPGGVPPAPDDWFTVDARVIDAFAGTAELIPTEGTRQATSTTTEADEQAGAGPAPQSGPDEGFDWRWAIGAVAVIVLVTVLVVRARGSKAPT